MFSFGDYDPAEDPIPDSPSGPSGSTEAPPAPSGSVGPGSGSVPEPSEPSNPKLAKPSGKQPKKAGPHKGPSKYKDISLKASSHKRPKAKILRTPLLKPGAVIKAQSLTDLGDNLSTFLKSKVVGWLAGDLAADVKAVVMRELERILRTIVTFAVAAHQCNVAQSLADYAAAGAGFVNTITLLFPSLAASVATAVSNIYRSRPSSPISAQSGSEVMTAVAELFDAVFSTISGVAVSGLHALRDSIRSVAKFSRDIREVHWLVNVFPDFVLKLYAKWYEAISGKTCVPFARRHHEPLVEKINALYAVATKYTVETINPGDAGVLADLREFITSVDKFNASIFELDKGGQYKETMPLISSWTRVSRVLAARLVRATCNTKRDCPISVWFHGPAASGKSTASAQLAAAYATDIGYESNPIFVIPTEPDAFWDNYYGNPVCLFPDVLSTTVAETNTSFLDCLMHIVDTDPVVVNKAEIDEKGTTPFTSSLIICHSNSSPFDLVCRTSGLHSMANTTAVMRRIHLDVFVPKRGEYHLKYTPPGSLYDPAAARVKLDAKGLYKALFDALKHPGRKGDSIPNQFLDASPAPDADAVSFIGRGGRPVKITPVAGVTSVTKADGHFVVPTPTDSDPASDSENDDDCPEIVVSHMDYIRRAVAYTLEAGSRVAKCNPDPDPDVPAAQVDAEEITSRVLLVESSLRGQTVNVRRYSALKIQVQMVQGLLGSVVPALLGTTSETLSLPRFVPLERLKTEVMWQLRVNPNLVVEVLPGYSKHVRLMAHGTPDVVRTDHGWSISHFVIGAVPVAVACAIAIALICKAKEHLVPLFAQALYTKSNKGAARRKRIQSANKKRINFRKVKGFSGIKAQVKQIPEDFFKTNSASVVFAFAGSTVSFKGFFINDRLLLTAAHAARMTCENDGHLSISTPNQVYDLIDVGTTSVWEDVDHDLAVIEFSTPLERVRYAKSLFVSSEKVEFIEVFDHLYYLSPNGLPYPRVFISERPPFTYHDDKNNPWVMTDPTLVVSGSGLGPGDSGSAVFAIVDGAYRIIGIHVAGGIDTGIVSTLSIEDLGSIVSAQAGRPTVDIFSGVDDIPYNPAPFTVSLSLSTRLVPTGITLPSTFPPNCDHPVPFPPPPGHPPVLAKAISRLNRTDIKPFGTEAIDFAKRVFIERYPDMHPVALSMQVVINGDGDHKGLDMSTSPGPGWPKFDGKLHLFDVTPEGYVMKAPLQAAIENLDRDLLSRATLYPSLALKDETLPPLKPRRPLIVFPLEFNMLGKRYFGDLIERIASHHVDGLFKCGINPASFVWGKIHRSHTRSGRLCSAEDISAHDSTCQEEVHQLALALADHYYNDGADNHRRREELLRLARSAPIIVQDRLYARNMNGTGQFATNFIASLQVLLNFCAVHRHFYPDDTPAVFLTVADLQIYGDDNLFSIAGRPAHSPAARTAFLADHGITVTSSVKTKSSSYINFTDEATFLRRSFRPEGSWVYAPLELAVFSEMLAYRPADLPLASWLPAVLVGASLEVSHHPRHIALAYFEAAAQIAREHQVEYHPLSYTEYQVRLRAGAESPWCPPDIHQLACGFQESIRAHSAVAPSTSENDPVPEDAVLPPLEPAQAPSPVGFSLGSRRMARLLFRRVQRCEFRARARLLGDWFARTWVKFIASHRVDPLIHAQNGVVRGDTLVQDLGDEVVEDDEVEPQIGNSSYDPVDFTSQPVIGRAYEGPLATWDATAARGSRIARFFFPDDLFSIAAINERLGHFEYLRTNVRITFKVNGTPFHSGLIRVVVMKAYGFDMPATLEHCDNLPGYDLSINSSEALSIVIPYVGPSTAIDLTNWVSGQLAAIGLYVNVPLQSGGGTVAPVTISVVFNFEDPHAYGPTADNGTILAHGKYTSATSEAVSKSRSGLLTTTSKDANDVSGKIGRFPMLGAVAKPFKSIASVFLKPVETISSWFGLDKPTTQQAPTPFFETNMRTAGHGEGLDTAVSIGIAPDTRAVMDVSLVGEEQDVFDVKTVALRSSLTGYTTFTAATVPGVIFTTPVGLAMGIENYPVTPGTFVVASWTQYLASFCDYYRGSMRMSFMFICSSFVSCRVQIGFLPWMYTDPTVPADPDLWAESLTWNIDVSGDTIANLVIPFMSSMAVHPSDAWRTNWSYGTVAVRLITPIVNTSASASSSIALIVRHSAHDDIELFGPPSISGYTNYTPISSESPVSAQCGEIKDSVPITEASSVAVTGVVFGASITSLRQIGMRRSLANPASWGTTKNEVRMDVVLRSSNLMNQILGPYGAHRGTIRLTVYQDIIPSFYRYTSVSAIAPFASTSDLSSFAVDQRVAPNADLELPYYSPLVCEDMLQRGNPVFFSRIASYSGMYFVKPGTTNPAAAFVSLGDDFTAGLIHYFPVLVADNSSVSLSSLRIDLLSPASSAGPSRHTSEPDENGFVNLQ